MNRVGVQTLKLADLVLPGDMPARKSGENARDLASDLKKYGEYLHAPVIRTDMRIIAGRDRVAGAMVEGRKSLVFTVVDCSDEEAEELELVENFHRRCDPEEQAAQRRRYLDLAELRLAKDEDDAPRGKGRPKTARGKAVDELAKREGVTPSALRQQDRRREESARDEEPAHEPEEVTEETGPSIRDFGLDVPPTVDARARRVQAAIDAMDVHLLALARLANGLEETGLPGLEADKLGVELKRLAHAVRGARPQALCPWCKGVVTGCMACFDAGFASTEKMRGDVPAELLRDAPEAMVAERGRYRPLAGGPSVQVVNGKRLTVVGENGEPLEVPGSDDDGLAF